MNLHHLQFESEMPVSVEELFAWHEKPSAFTRLCPPWDKIRIIKPPESLQKGTKVELEVKIGPIWKRLVAEHFEYEKNKLFADRQIIGPFGFWEHFHEFIAKTPNASIMRDKIHFSAPFGFLGNLFLTRFLKQKIRETFIYRHETLANDLQACEKAKGTTCRNIAITGANGLIGKNLSIFLEMAGFNVFKITRNTNPNHSNEVSWNPLTEDFPESILKNADAIIHLAGESIATGNWTKSKKEKIKNSRVVSTQKIATALKTIPNRVRAFLCASAIGIYKETPGESLVESSELGSDFLAEVGKEWESAALSATNVVEKVVTMRFGIILSLLGGALPELLKPFQFRMGRFWGYEKANFSWITLDDVLHGILHLLTENIGSGPVNFTAPSSVTNSDFISTLESIYHKKAFIPVPTLPLKLLMGEKAERMILADFKVLPQKLELSGYKFLYPTLEPALRHLLGKHH